METKCPRGPLEPVVGRHTPGPWRVGKPFQPAGRNDTNPVVPIYAHDHGCASCGRGKGEWLVAWTFKNATPNRWKSDAALLAAAPELLAALQMLDERGHTDATWAFAKQAIAKALGVPPNAVLSRRWPIAVGSNEALPQRSA